MGPRSVIARDFFQKVEDLRKTFDALVASNKAAIHSDDERHDAEARGARRDNALVSGDVFQRCPGDGVSAFPVIAKAGLLQHGEQLIVGKLSGRGACRLRKGRLPVGAVNRLHTVGSLYSRSSNKVRVAIEAG